jgi:hypothetical protein
MRFESSESEQRTALSESEQQLVESLERLPMNDSSKFDALLVWRGEKLASDTRVILKTWKEGEDRPEMTDEERRTILERVQEIFQAMGLFSIEGEDAQHEPEADGKPGEINKEFYVSPIKGNAQKLKELWEANDEVKNSREIGALYGFPPTGIEAYGQFFEQGYRKGFKNREMTIEQDELPPDIQNEDFMAFAQFRLSKDNWTEELETAKRWAAEIQNVDPALYERIVKKYHDGRE